MPSETSKVRHIVTPYIYSKNIIDLGFGYDKIIPEAIGADQGSVGDYLGQKLGEDTLDMVADVSVLIPVPDNTYDIVYSSHLIEDFNHPQTIITEMIRVLKNNGRLIMVFPDQKRYQELESHIGLNPHHKHADMGLDFMKRCLSTLSKDTGYIFDIIFESDCKIDYNVIIIADVTKYKCPFCVDTHEKKQ